MVYRSLLRPILFRLPPETAHHLALQSLSLLLAPRTVNNLVASHFKRNPLGELRRFGLAFSNPIGLAAGFDKDGIALQALSALGFGFIEAKIMEHKSVASCAVIGVPDPQRGQAIKAFVKLLPGFTPSELMIKEIQIHVKTRLAAHEAPREIEFMDEFPSTVTGKIMRRELRAREEQKRRTS